MVELLAAARTPMVRFPAISSRLIPPGPTIDTSSAISSVRGRDGVPIAAVDMVGTRLKFETV